MNQLDVALQDMKKYLESSYDVPHSTILRKFNHDYTDINNAKTQINNQLLEVIQSLETLVSDISLEEVTWKVAPIIDKIKNITY
jgi:hypothetical protein